MQVSMLNMKVQKKLKKLKTFYTSPHGNKFKGKNVSKGSYKKLYQTFICLKMSYKVFHQTKLLSSFSSKLQL